MRSIHYWLILSGVLVEQADGLAQMLEGLGLREVKRDDEDEWRGLVMVRD